MPVTVGILNLLLLSENFRKGLFVGNIVNIRNECLFSGFIGNELEPGAKKARFVCTALRFISHEPRKKDTHSLIGQSAR